MISEFDVAVSAGVKQASPALPAFDLRGSRGNIASKGKAGETFALPLQDRVNRWADPAEAGRVGV